MLAVPILGFSALLDSRYSPGGGQGVVEARAGDPGSSFLARIAPPGTFLSQKLFSTRRRAVTPNLPIVGIGASAGGVEALERFFKAMPADNGMAFVVVTHLPPNRESMLAEIIGRSTQMPVVNARDGETVEAEHVYVLPPGAILTIR